MSSTYDAQSWQLPGGSISWDSPAPPSRSSTRPFGQDSGAGNEHSPGTTSMAPREDAGAFDTQLDEIARAQENLMKSGKLHGGASRRDSMPLFNSRGSFSDFSDQRNTHMSQQRHHSIGDYDQLRSHRGSVHSFYSGQRQPRAGGADPAVQSKRREAAERERELRNYHQEQQYNRHANLQGKQDRASSPSAMTEESRRELIARQHQALYGNKTSPYVGEGSFADESHTPRPSNAFSGQGPSPRSNDPFARGSTQMNSTDRHNQFSGPEPLQQQQATAGGNGPSPNTQQQQHQRSRANSTSSPVSNAQSQGFSLFEATAQQSSRTSTSSPGGSPPRTAKTSAPGGGGSSSVAPIGTRPAGGQGVSSTTGMNKHATPPVPSPLGFGLNPGDKGLGGNASSGNNNERAQSSASNPSAGTKEPTSAVGWGSSSGGVWGKNSLGVQASVWG